MQLFAAANTDRDVFRDAATGLVYVLLSGRWYAAADLDRGPWRYIAPDQLPAGFAAIPAEGRWADIRAHVAGTPESEEAAMDARLPQTAAIPRDATVAVAYDGDPAWQSIQGTQLSYALNTDQEVISAPGGTFYCCDAGAWYVASGASGPWTVAAATPPGLDAIPPDCPIYNVRFVQVYECTQQVCYCGYTGGYTGCYVVSGCLVWGTGYAYDPWWHHHYHPRLWTWGLGMSYDPWTCTWGTDVEARFGGLTGWSAFGMHSAAGRWWGPCGYRPAFIHSGRPSPEQILRERQRIPERERPRFDLAARHAVYREGCARARAPAATRAPSSSAGLRAPNGGPPRAARRVVPPHPEGDCSTRHTDQGWGALGRARSGNRRLVRASGPAREPGPAHQPEPIAPGGAGAAARSPSVRTRPAAPAPERGAWSEPARQELTGSCRNHRAPTAAPSSSSASAPAPPRSGRPSCAATSATTASVERALRPRGRHALSPCG